MTFEELLAEAEQAPIDGWDFNWLTGRATEDRPLWGYAAQLADRMAKATAALDIQTGGGEVLSKIHTPPPVLVATESWPPNVVLARKNLSALGASVTEVADHAALPYPEATFDLVVSRHPTVTIWDEISRVLAPGGTYFSQQVGPGSALEVAEFLLGPQPVNDQRTVERAIALATSAGLDVLTTGTATLQMTFYDIAAVVYFLRKVIWIIPDFSIARYRAPLLRLHQLIEKEGSFVAHARRFLIEARKPASAG